jgi:hypothetical protein
MTLREKKRSFCFFAGAFLELNRSFAFVMKLDDQTKRRRRQKQIRVFFFWWCRQLTSCMSAPPPSFVPHLPVDIARLTAASAVNPASCAKLVDMRADELISNACAANPKCKELRDAAGVHGMASAAAALPSLM